MSAKAIAPDDSLAARDRDRALDAISQILALSNEVGTVQECGFNLGHINRICWIELAAARRASGGEHMTAPYLSI